MRTGRGYKAAELADVLSEYQERIAEEARLQTGADRRSLRELRRASEGSLAISPERSTRCRTGKARQARASGLPASSMKVHFISGTVVD